MTKTVSGIVAAQPWFVPHITDPNKNVLVVQINDGKELISVATKGHRLCNIMACWLSPGKTMHFFYEEDLGINWAHYFVFGPDSPHLLDTFMCDEDGLSTIPYQKRMEVFGQWKKEQIETGWDGKSNMFGFAVVDKNRSFKIPE